MAIIDLYLPDRLWLKVRLQTKPFESKIAKSSIFVPHSALDASQRLV
jgi:hypothetical protein